MCHEEIQESGSNLSLVRIAVVAGSGEYDMIQKGHFHEFGGLFHPFGQSVIFPTGTKVARRVVMAKQQAGGEGVYTGFQDQTNIDSGLGDTALADLNLAYHFIVTVEGGHP